MRSLSLVLLSLSMLGSRIVPAKADTSPYIYYYSLDRQSFIVERADGSDSRVLAHYQLPPYHIAITGPGWSPSGQWFAWTSNNMGGTANDQNVNIVDRSGKIRYTVLSTTGQITALNWSSTADLLLVVFSIGQTDEQAVIYSPPKNQILTMVTAGTSAPNTDPYTFYNAFWSGDGRYAFLFNGNRLTLLYPDGKQYSVSVKFNEIYTCKSFLQLPHSFDNGRFAYFDADKNALIIENEDGTGQESIVLPAGQLGSLDWNADGTYALIHLQPTAQTVRTELWLLSLKDKTLTGVSDNDYPGPFTSPDPCYTPFDRTAWNAKDQGAFLTEKQRLWLIDAPSGKLTDISPTPSGQVRDNTSLSWTNDGRLLFTWDDAGSLSIYAYNPVSKQASVLATNVGLSFYSVPIIGDYLFYFGDNGDKSYVVVVNTKINTQSHIEFDAPPELSPGQPGRVVPHPTDKWLFMVSEDFTYNGSINGYAINDAEYLYLVNVACYEGTIQRQLATCPDNADSRSCFGWLPEQK